MRKVETTTNPDMSSYTFSLPLIVAGKVEYVEPRLAAGMIESVAL
jgi:hypothetical protein